jgi:hypothetical protein
MPQGGADLTGRKVRLTGYNWNGMTHVGVGAIRTVKTHSRPSDGRVESVTLKGRGYIGFLNPRSSFAVEPLPPRERIWVYSWITESGNGGFDWKPVDRDPGSAEWLQGEVYADHEALFREGVLVELWVAGYAPDDAGRARVTEFLEGEWQDAISRGLVGKIIDRY